MEEKRNQERSLRHHMAKLIKLTKNLSSLTNKLMEYEVLSQSEGRQIKLCSDEETSCNLLYEMIITKLPYSFDLLLFSMKDTDNERLAQLIEDSALLGDENTRRIRRQSSSGDRYAKQETRSVAITGGEMGIAELFDDYPELTENLSNLTRILRLKDYQPRWNGTENFITKATLVLREFVVVSKMKATVEMLCRLLEDEKLHECSERIRRMFDNYVDSGLAFDFPGSFTISGKEMKIAQVLDDNPSFCLHPERLYLMLNLPMKTLTNFTNETTFVKNATRMLSEWVFLNPQSSSTDHLAALLALNGHFCTAEKVSHL